MNVSIGFIYDICERERVGRTGRTKTGPINVSCVVWALGELFSFFPSYYLIPIDFLLYV